jgi:hypothetical protein
MRTLSRVLSRTVIVACTLAASGCVGLSGVGWPRYVEREEKRFSVSGKPDLSVSTFDGSVQIRPWDRPEVLVEVEKRAVDKEAAATIEVHAEQNGNRIRVDVRTGSSLGWNASRSANLIVSVPASADVQAASGDGALSIERITGKIDLRSGDGSIHGSGLAGDLHARTGDGSINLDGVSGAVDLETGDGSVAVVGTLTRVHARSGDGSVSVRAAAGSTTGDDWDINTGDGSVSLDLPEAFGAELDAHTGDGHIQLRDITVSNVSGEIGKDSVRGRLGPGGHALRVRTGDGSITLRSGR